MLGREKLEAQRIERLNSVNLNNQGCLMKIVEYYEYNNIIVEFQDEHKAKVKSRYDHFLSGGIINPYYKSLYGVGMMGKDYKSPYKLEYKIWASMMCRCYNEKYLKTNPTYKNVICVKDWHLFENFYNWLHNQENFETLKNFSQRFALDKDILIKGNKIYAPDKCCLVPQSVNNLFIKSEKTRGEYPLGINYAHGYYYAVCSNGAGKLERLGRSKDVREAFNLYKNYKEKRIKEVAKENYKKGLITKNCYDAMLRYQVEFCD